MAEDNAQKAQSLRRRLKDLRRRAGTAQQELRELVERILEGSRNGEYGLAEVGTSEADLANLLGR